MATYRAVKNRRKTLASVLACAAMGSALLTFAYNPFQDQVNGAAFPTRWPTDSVTGMTTVTWNLNPTTGSNVNTAGGDSVQTAITKSFSAWQTTQFNGQTLNTLNITQGPDSSLTTPNSSDCLNVVAFTDSNSKDFPSGVIAFTEVTTRTGTPPFTYTCTSNGTTTTQTSNIPSVLSDADVEFNPAVNFSTSSTTPSGSFDLQSTATHEIGHLLGLDHSGIAHAVMYPFGDTGVGEQKQLAVDDVMGIAFLYPAPAFSAATGTLSGSITLNSAGIFAAHVLAVDAQTGDAVLDGLTNPDGTYKLVGVPPATYNVLALPLTGVYTLSDFSGWSCGYGESSPPCCDPKTPTCVKPVPNPTNYTGKFF